MESVRAPHTFELTPDQEATLHRLPLACKVVGVERRKPVIREVGGRLLVMHESGQLLRANGQVRQAMECRLIDLVFPRCR
jgi:hypothetical protein